MTRLASPVRRMVLLACSASILGGIGPAWAATADDCTDLCGIGTGACTISATWDIDPGSDLDCGTRNVTLTGAGVLRVTNGDFRLAAGNLTVDGPGGTITSIEGTGGTADVPGSIVVELSGALSLSGKIRANGTRGGGNIHVHAAGNITIPESGTDGIEALGTSNTASGGRIVVETDGSFVANDPVLADGGGPGANAGGSIEIRAAGSITTDLDGHISAYGRTGGGGSITVAAGGSITLLEHLKAEGQGDYADGGQIEVVAGDALSVQADLSVMGGVNVSGAHSNGGEMLLQSRCGGTTIAANLNATGGQAGSDDENGGITIETSGSLVVATGKVLDTHARQSGGRGGPIRLVARDLITMNASSVVDSRGSATSPGAGGAVTLQACRLNLTNGSTIDTSGYRGGTITLNASQDPPAEAQEATVPEPLLVASAAVVRAAGSTAAANGRIALAPLTGQRGRCSNFAVPNIRYCTLDTDCTEGCQTGDCQFANPDTGGINTQFDIVPARVDEASQVRCESTCDSSAD